MTYSLPLFRKQPKIDQNQKSEIVTPCHVECNSTGDIELVFSGQYRSVFLGIYHTDTEGNLGRYISVSFFWREPLFPSKRGHWPPFWGKKGATAPFSIQPAPLLRKKGVPAKLVIPTGNTDRQVNLIPAKYRYVVYNSRFSTWGDDRRIERSPSKSSALRLKVWRSWRLFYPSCQKHHLPANIYGFSGGKKKH